MLFSFRLYLCSGQITSSESDRDPFCRSCHLAQDPLEELENNCLSARCYRGSQATSVRGTEGERTARRGAHCTGRHLLPSAASRLAASRLFRFHLTKPAIPDLLCSVPVARGITAERKLLGRGMKVGKLRQFGVNNNGNR